MNLSLKVSLWMNCICPVVNIFTCCDGLCQRRTMLAIRPKRKSLREAKCSKVEKSKSDINT